MYAVKVVEDWYGPLRWNKYDSPVVPKEVDSSDLGDESGEELGEEHEGGEEGNFSPVEDDVVSGEDANSSQLHGDDCVDYPYLSTGEVSHNPRHQEQNACRILQSKEKSLLFDGAPLDSVNVVNEP